MRMMKRTVTALAAVWLMFSGVASHADSFYFLYANLRGTECYYTTDPSYGPYYAYFNVDVDVNYPAGAKLHSVTYVNGALTSDTWTTFPTALSATLLADRIDSSTPDFTGKKLVELWVNGALVSQAEIAASCTKDAQSPNF